MKIKPYFVLSLVENQGPVSQRITIICTIDINRSSMVNHVLRKLAIKGTG